MKQLLSLSLFLLPCLALAQYPSNGNQKITLGEQTTADGLIWRGVLGDTLLITPSSDTSAYIILDTVNHRFYNYNRATNVWSVAGGGTAVTTFSGGTTGLTPSDATSGAVTLGGTLAVANGGTNATTLTANKVMVGNGTSGVLTPTNLHWDNTNSRLGISISSPLQRLDVNGLGRFSDGTQGLIIGAYTGGAGYGAIYPSTVTPAAGNYLFAATSDQSVLNCGDNIQLAVAGVQAFSIINNRNVGIGNTSPGSRLVVKGIDGTNSNSALNATNSTDNSLLFVRNNGSVGIGTTTPQSGYRLHVIDSVYVGGNVSAAAYTTRSDYNLKDDIFDLKYGLNDVLKLQPVEYTYKSNGSKQLGFIAQDIGTILPEVVSFEESMSVNYQAIIPILTKAIQEQQSLIKALEQRIINLENK
jgi:hypothetical protein